MLLLVTALGPFASVPPVAAQTCIVTTPIGSGHEEGLGVAIQPDGKIVVVGFSDVGAGNSDFAVVRYDSSLGLDTSFDGDGKVTTPVGAANETAVDVAIQPDGKIVVVGFSDVGAGNNDFAVVRYNPSGSLDTSFDVDGRVTTGIGGDDQARSVAIQADGKIVVAGWSFFGGRYQFAAARYNANGSLDAGFDADGIVTTALGAVDDKGYSVALQPDGKIVLAGETNNGANFDYGVVRYNPNGSLDIAFDVDGRVTTDIGANGDFGRSVSLQPDGKIVVVGTTIIAGSLDFSAVRYNPNGSLDTTFDGDGKVSTPVGSLNEFEFAGALQLDGKIVTAGHSDVGAANFDVAAVRYISNGSLDTSFSGDGKVTTAIGRLDDRGHALALQPDGKIVVAGSSNNGSNFDFSVVRYHPDGRLDATCGTCAGGGTWWNYTWGRRRKLGFDNTGQAQNLSGFPVLVKLDSTRIDYSRTQNAGQDIRFVDADDQTLLDHEIELWNEAGVSYVWVRVPQIDASSGADSIYMYYDNAAAPDAQNAAGVWSGGGYQGVWHLKENPAGAPPQMKDSTANLNHGTAEFAPVQVAGQIDGSLAFDGTNERDVNIPNSASLSLPTELTVSGWARLAPPLDGQPRLIVAKWKAAGGNSFWLGKLDATQMAFGLDGGGPSTAFAPIGFVNDLAWHHVVGVAEAGGTMRIYVDGVQRGTSAFTPPIQTGTSEVRIGRSPDVLLQDWNGGLDEVRVESVARSADWVRAQYLSTADVFIAYGAETGVCFLRSIGTAPDRSSPGDGTVTATNGSTVVTGSGTLWKTWNRGRGDVITIDGTNYVVLGVGSETKLGLTSPFAGTTGSGKSYTMARQFTTPAAWEDCIDGGGTSCGLFPPVPSSSLVADNRSEVGIAYKEGNSVWMAGVNTPLFQIQGSTTDAAHTITLTADGVNRHNGISDSGVVFRSNPASIDCNLLDIGDPYTTVEWIEWAGDGSGTNNIDGPTVVSGIEAGPVVIRNNIFRNFGSAGFEIQGTLASVDFYNNFFYGASALPGRGLELDPGAPVNIQNNTFYLTGAGSNAILGTAAAPNVVMRNNLAVAADNDYAVPGFNAASGNNMSGDATAPGAGSFINVCLSGPSCVNLVSPTDLHLQGASFAIDKGANLGSLFLTDIDGAVRSGTWDIGADEFGVTTEITLLSFAATGEDSAVDLSWTTASELRNLGFHLYRSDAPDGPYSRITTSLIPGLGSSPTGQNYSYRDAGLVNGRTYYYELEDIETTGGTERHGPVFATPGTTSGGFDTPPGSTEATGTSYGDPSSVTLREVERSPSHVVLELLTGGFVASPAEEGRVHLRIPGFESVSRPGEPSLPMRRTLVEAASGKKVRVASISASDELRFPGLRPVSQGMPGIEMSEEGAILPSEEKRRDGPGFGGLFPVASALLGMTSFQRETKKAEVLLFPLRWDGSGLVLSRRLRVRLEFGGTQEGENSRGGSLGRRRVPRSSHERRGVVAQFLAEERGLYRVDYEEIFPTLPGRPQRGISASNLRLSRQGDSVAFHVEPQGAAFGPGSSLFFLSEGSSLNPYGDAVYELETNAGGLLMGVERLSPPSRVVVAEYFETREKEENHYYQAGLLEAPDLWLWDIVVSPGSKSYAFTVDQLAGSSSSAGRLSLTLQGASDFEGVLDHHVRVGVNGRFVGETSWDGKQPTTLELELEPGVLQEGPNTLELEDVGDAGASYSMVFLNRFSLSYPRRLVAVQGTLEGSFGSSGLAEIVGLGASSFLLDTTDVPRWLTGASATPLGLSVPVQAGRSYLLTSTFLRPGVKRLEPSGLKSVTNRADYLLLAPQLFLPAAQPLLDLRESQGLLTQAVSLEEVYEQFGHGEVSPEAIKEFLEYAYHSWSSPSPRYVLLLGDASYDPKDYLQTGVRNWLPGFPVRTRYLWTVSDPAYAAVNGDDLLPDLAIGRLPAGSVEEARRLVQKVLAFENGGGNLDGPAVLVADNADLAGNFEADADEIASTLLASRNPRKIYYSQEGIHTRTRIKEAFDEGASFLSYMGHGGTVVWASENIFNYQDVNALALQPQQPLLLTLNCLNGFFHFPPFNSLSEELLKAEGKGVIGAFSPSGLSVNDAAHLFHKAVLQEFLSGQHERLGDAILAAQDTYSDSGAFPELLSIYHLLGDPAMRIRW